MDTIRVLTCEEFRKEAEAQADRQRRGRCPLVVTREMHNHINHFVERHCQDCEAWWLRFVAGHPAPPPPPPQADHRADLDRERAARRAEMLADDEDDTDLWVEEDDYREGGD